MQLSLQPGLGGIADAGNILDQGYITDQEKKRRWSDMAHKGIFAVLALHLFAPVAYAFISLQQTYYKSGDKYIPWKYPLNEIGDKYGKENLDKTESAYNTKSDFVHHQKFSMRNIHYASRLQKYHSDQGDLAQKSTVNSQIILRIPVRIITYKHLEKLRKKIILNIHFELKFPVLDLVLH